MSVDSQAKQALSAAVFAAANDVQQHDFLPLFSAHILPHLPDSKLAGITEAFRIAAKGQMYVTMESRYESSLDRQTQGLDALCQDKEAYEEQNEMQEGICAEISEWAEALLPAIIEERRETFDTVDSSLQSMRSTLSSTTGASSRCDFNDAAGYEFKYPGKGTVYKSYSIKRVLLKMTRDLYLSALCVGESKFVHKGLRQLQKEDLLGDFDEYVRSESTDGDSEVKDEDDDGELDDSWHPQAWQDVMPLLRAAVIKAEPDKKEMDSTASRRLARSGRYQLAMRARAEEPRKRPRVDSPTE